MLQGALVFLLVGLVAALLGFTTIAGASFALAKVLAGIFLFFRRYFRDARASLYGLIVMFGSWLADAPHFSNVYKLSVFFSVAGYPSTSALAVGNVFRSAACAHAVAGTASTDVTHAASTSARLIGREA